MKWLDMLVPDFLNFTAKDWIAWFAIVCIVGWFLFAVYDGFRAAAGFDYKSPTYTEEYIKHQKDYTYK